MRIIIGLILLTTIYGAYHFIFGLIAWSNTADFEDDARMIYGAKIFVGALLSLAVLGILVLMFGGGAS